VSSMERRREERIETKVYLNCRVPALPVLALMHDLSHGGCRLEFRDANIHPGGTILLELPGSPRTPGVVRWRRGRETGVRFERDLGRKTAIALGLDQPDPDQEPEPIQPPEPVGGFLSHWIRRLMGRGSR